MPQKRPFSIVLPDGSHGGSFPSLVSALYRARNYNASRQARGLPLLVVIDRNTGSTYTAEPNAEGAE